MSKVENSKTYPFVKNSQSLVFSKFKFGSLLFAYFFSLQCLYQFGVAPLFEYQGFVDIFNLSNFLVSILLLFVMLFILRESRRPSDFFMILAAVLIVIPSLVIYSGANLPDEYISTTFSAFVLMAFFSRLKLIKRIKFSGVTNRRLLFVLSMMTIVTVVGIIAFGGLRFVNFSLAAVYENRKEAADNLPGIFGYLNSIVPKVIIPFAMVIALLERRWWVMVFIGSMSLLFFILTSHKSPLLYPIVVLFFYFTAQSKKIGQYLLILLVFVVLVSLADLWYFQKHHEWWSGWFGSILGRRSLLIPALLNWDYLEFFSKAEKYYWAQSKLSFGLVDQSYDLSPAKLIGDMVFNKEEMSANTGWIGSGYSNAGIWGVAVYSILIGLLFSFIDQYGRKLGTRVVIGTFSLPVLIMLTSTDLSNMILNHGLIVAILILMIVRGRKGEIKGGMQLA